MDNDAPLAADGSVRPEPSAARAALEQLEADASRLAARVVTPWWYHLALGLIVAAFAAAQAVPGPAAIAVVALGVVSLPVLTTAYSRRYGLSTTHPTGRRSRRLLLGVVAVVVVAMATSLAIKILALSAWWVLLPSALAFGATVVLGRRYDDALRGELGQRAGSEG